MPSHAMHLPRCVAVLMDGWCNGKRQRPAPPSPFAHATTTTATATTLAGQVLPRPQEGGHGRRHHQEVRRPRRLPQAAFLRGGGQPQGRVLREALVPGDDLPAHQQGEEGLRRGQAQGRRRQRHGRHGRQADPQEVLRGDRLGRPDGLVRPAVGGGGGLHQQDGSTADRAAAANAADSAAAANATTAAAGSTGGFADARPGAVAAPAPGAGRFPAAPRAGAFHAGSPAGTVHRVDVGWMRDLA